MRFCYHKLLVYTEERIKNRGRPSAVIFASVNLLLVRLYERITLFVIRQCSFYLGVRKGLVVSSAKEMISHCLRELFFPI